jgi:hypothetical protein
VTDERLRAELRRVAAEHQPDRTAMLNRIAANRESGRAPRRHLLRLVGSAVAVAAVLGAAGIASALTAKNSPGTRPAAPPPATAQLPAGSGAPSPSAPSTGSPTPGRTQSPAPSTPSAAPVRGHPGDTQVEKGSLWSDGSIVPAGSGGAQSTVTVKASVDLTALDLTIRVVLTPGVVDRGATTDVAGGRVVATVERQPGALLYHFVLREGSTLAAGTYHFTAGYAYAGASRDAGDDTYEAFATDADRRRPHIYGNFAATTK